MKKGKKTSMSVGTRSMRSLGSSGRRKKKRVDKKRLARYKFRALVRTVIGALMWLADTTNVELGANPETNAYIIAHRRNKRQLFTLQDKSCLRRPPELRDRDLIDGMYRKTKFFKGFQFYSEKTRKELLSRAYFNAWEKGRVLVRQGQEAQYVYFIIEGIVLSDEQQPHPLFPGEFISNVDKYQEGDIIGSLPIFYNEPHHGTVTVFSDYVEVLMLDKENFKNLLETTVHKVWNEVKWAMKKIPHFDNFPEKSIRAICAHAVLENYPMESIIPMKDSMDTDIVTFVIDGCLNVIEPLYFFEDSNKKDVNLRYTFFPKEKLDEIDVIPSKIRRVFMQTCTLKRRSVVGLGERLSNYTIICETDVMALVIPKFVLNRHNPANIWERVVGQLDLTYPSEQDVFDAFVNNKGWIRYKKEFVKTLKSDKKTTMSIHDVPLILRARQLRIRGELLKKVSSMPLCAFGELDIENKEAEMAKLREYMKNKFNKKAEQDLKESFEEIYESLKEDYKAYKMEGRNHSLKRRETMKKSSTTLLR